MKLKKFYILANSDGYVLSNKYELAAEQMLGYGGVWTKDRRKAKRFKTQREVQDEVNKMPGHGTYMMIGSNENFKAAIKWWRKKL